MREGKGFLYMATLLAAHCMSVLLALEINKSCKYNFMSSAPNVQHTTKVRATGGRTGGKIIGHGHSYPSNEIHNDELRKYVDTNDEWIRTRTGIKKRRILKRNENISMLQIESASRALKSCSMNPLSVDMIINASSTPQNLFGDANNISNKLGCRNSVNMDLTAACTGFVFAFATAYNFLPKYRNILIVGSDALSNFVDWRDRNTCVLFGDAAGAVVLQRTEPNEENHIYDYSLGSNSELNDLLTINFECDRYNLENPNINKYGKLNMNGKEVFKYTISNLPRIVQTATHEANIKMEEIDYFIFHQANIRIIESVAKSLGIPLSKVLVNLDEHANTSAASIPLCLSENV
ncbi:beta-ketoacyl-acyl carrier protein synthase III [Plasmodium vivax India VII]|uniref:Beta-ketoacyl-acyl carrier protein synthase III n=4 Tax=Plasmodium vivax TaxID=5855 RepID=A0A0J9TJ63_PLAVI|nr:beta-ketoacyl-acyl carrier protein synthase III [Plasmodium vivax India VII]KMZ88407.1 beta-ketoacyl-acyl carrier protein synthase III [Plasmodium vivax Brazil I]KMZ94772.1 beta-ketoacyl-acyl carrier protein synthase III [Plasmodium vivax Mauritania I]KNA01420.1 beta-ketoacyl-acyl carrier protein synthase III [Plasmodium vivax North Korean]